MKKNKIIEYIVKHKDGVIVDTFKHYGTALQFQQEYHKNFGERLIIKKIKETKNEK